MFAIQILRRCVFPLCCATDRSQIVLRCVGKNILNQGVADAFSPPFIRNGDNTDISIMIANLNRSETKDFITLLIMQAKIIMLAFNTVFKP